MNLKKIASDSTKDALGNASSARVIGVRVINWAIVFVAASIVFAFLHPTQAAAIIGVGAGLFTTMTTPTFVYLYNNKVKELGAYFNNGKMVSNVNKDAETTK